MNFSRHCTRTHPASDRRAQTTSNRVHTVIKTKEFLSFAGYTFTKFQY